MVSGTRDNPTPQLPWARYSSTHLFKKFRLSNRLHEVGEITWGGELSPLDRVARAGETTFSHVNSSDRPPGTRQQKLNCVRLCIFAIFVVNLFLWSIILLRLRCSLILPRKKGKNLGADVYYPCLLSNEKLFRAKILTRANGHCRLKKTAFYSNYKLLQADCLETFC